MHRTLRRWSFAAALAALLAALPAQTPTTANSPAAALLQGRIVDLLGAPVPAAEVWVTQRRLPLAMTRSDASGTFFLPGLPYGDLELHARAAGKAHSCRTVRVDADAAFHFAELQLTDGAALRGRVTSLDGRALAGATVLARPAVHELIAMPVETATTDADGNYAFADTVCGDNEITVLAAGHGVQQQIQEVDGQATLDFRLAPGPTKTLLIRIRGADEATLRRAECAAAIDWRGQPLALPPWLGSGTADARGDFVVTGLPSDVAFREQRVRLVGAATTWLRGKAIGDEQFVAEYACHTVGPLHGRVTDQRHQGLAGVTLRCRAAGSEVTVVTAADGRFEVPGLLAAGDPFELALADPHLKWPPQYGAGPISAGTFGGRFDPAQDYALAVTTATVITGVIRDSAGRPAAGANVALQIAGQPVRGPGRDLKLPSAIADRDGRVTFSHVSPSLPGEFRLQARAGDDLAVSDAFGLAVEEDTKAPAIALHPGARLDGVLVDASGKPLAGAAVSLQSVKGPTDPFRAVTLTDRQGRYAFACLPAGTYRRAFAQRSSDSMIATRPPIELADGEHKVEGPAR